MSRLGINTGNNANDGQGDTLRSAMGKINVNFQEIYNSFGNGFDLVSYASTSGISTLARNLTGNPIISVGGVISSGISSVETIQTNNLTVAGVVTAIQFRGDGSQLTNVVASSPGVQVYDENIYRGVADELNFGTGLSCSIPDGSGRSTIALTTSIVFQQVIVPVNIKDNGAVIGAAGTIDFGSGLSVSPLSAGVVTVTSTVGVATIVGIDTTGTSFFNELNVSGVSTFGDVVIGGPTTSLVVNGNARITGILTIGTSSLTLDGSNNEIKIGTGVTIKESGSASFTQGLNVSGVITATSFSGSGVNLTGVVTSVVGLASEGYVDEAVSGVSTFSGDYNDLTNKPTIPSISGLASEGYVDSAVVGFVTSGIVVGLASEGYVDAAVSGVSTFSGDYNDLTNKPTIPVNLTDLSDVNAGAPSTGQVLKWSGSEWQAAADLTTSGVGIGLSDLSVTISSPGINSLTYNNITGVFQFTPSAFVSYASSSGISTISEGLAGNPNIDVNEVGISSYLIVAGVTTFLNDVHIEDSKVLIIGDNDELQIFHSGVDSYIDNSSAGNLIIRDGGTGIQLRRSGGGPGAGLMAAFNNDAGVQLFYDSVLKLQTFQDGVAINDSVGIGTTAGNPPYRLTVSGVGATITSGLENAIADLTSSVDGYGQVNIRNSRSAPNASGDLVITADTGTDTSNYIDLGINNTGFSTSSWTINGVLDGYLYASDSNLSIGVAAAGKYLSLFAGGTLAENEKVRITETGVGIGSTQPTSMFAVGGDVRVSGVITATAFYGSGSNLSGILTSGALSGYATTELLDSVVSSIPTFDQDLSTTNDVTFNRIGITTGVINVGYDNSLLINVEDGESGVSTYTFDTGGNLTIPGNIYIDGNSGYVLFNNGGSKLQAEPTNDFEIHVGGFNNKVTGFGTDGSLTVPGTITLANGLKLADSGSGLPGNFGFIGDETTDVLYLQGQNGVVLTFPDGLDEPDSFLFDASGITFPDSTVQTTAYTGTAVGSAGTWAVNAVGIHTTKNVGIGTTLSSSALTVEGDGRFSGVVTATRFESTSAGTPTIDSPDNLNINAVTVAISTDLTVGGDAYVGVDTSSGLILTSPNGTQYRLVVDNSGNLSTVLVP